MHSIYIYALSDDLATISEDLVAAIDRFIAQATWRCPAVRAVDQSHEQGDGIVARDLGINIDLPERGSEPPGWFHDIEKVIDFAIRARRTFDVDFVIGIGDTCTGIAEDIIEIEDDNPDMDYLRNFIGVGGP